MLVLVIEVDVEVVDEVELVVEVVDNEVEVVVDDDVVDVVDSVDVVEEVDVVEVVIDVEVVLIEVVTRDLQVPSALAYDVWFTADNAYTLTAAITPAMIPTMMKPVAYAWIGPLPTPGTRLDPP